MSSVIVALASATRVLIGIPVTNATTYIDVSNKLQTITYYADTTARLFDSSVVVLSDASGYTSGAYFHTGAAGITTGGITVPTSRFAWAPGAPGGTSFLTVELPRGTRLQLPRIETVGRKLDSATGVVSDTSGFKLALPIPGVFATPPSAPASLAVTPLPSRLVQLSWTTPAREFVTTWTLAAGATAVPLTDVSRVGDIFTASFNPAAYLATDTSLTLTLGNGGLTSGQVSSTTFLFRRERVTLLMDKPRLYVTATQTILATSKDVSSITVTPAGTTLGAGAEGVTLDVSGAVGEMTFHSLRAGPLIVGATTVPPSTVFPILFDAPLAPVPYTLTFNPPRAIVGQPIAVTVTFPDIGPTPYSTMATLNASIVGATSGRPIGSWLNGTNRIPLTPGTPGSYSATWIPAVAAANTYFYLLSDDAHVDLHAVPSVAGVESADLCVWTTSGVVKPGELVTVSAGYTASFPLGGTVEFAADAPGIWSASISGSLDVSRGVVSRTFAPAGPGLVTFTAVGTARDGKKSVALTTGATWTSRVLVAGAATGFLLSPTV